MASKTNNIQPTTPHLVHSHDVQLDADYTRWLVELKARYRSAQIKAAVRVNAEKLLFNWQLGRDLVIKKAESRWGEGIVEQLSLDLQAEFPGETGFGAANLWYMKKWYIFYTQTNAAEKLHQLGSELAIAQKLAQPVREINALKIPAQPVREIDTEKLKQPVSDFPAVFAFVPWGHHRVIISKSDTIDQALFYIRSSIENGWSRDRLERAFRDDLYKLKGHALTNFSQQLPETQSRLAQEIVKDNYDLSFVSLRENFDERELEDELERNITQFLLELGNGFAFLGRQREIRYGDNSRKIDLLFYHIRLRCYVVVELKARAFEPEYAGKLNFYVNMVNDTLRQLDENPTIGLLICSDMDKAEVQWSFQGIQSPIGVATYNGIKVSDVLPSEELLRQRVRQLEQELRLSRKLINKFTSDELPE